MLELLEALAGLFGLFDVVDVVYRVLTHRYVRRAIALLGVLTALVTVGEDVLLAVFSLAVAAVAVGPDLRARLTASG